MRDIRLTLLGSMMLTIIASATLGAGIFAYFSDTETSSGNTFQAATLDLKVDDTDEPNLFHFEVTDFKPGQCRNHTFILKNTGSIPGVASLTFKNLIQMENGIIEPEEEAGDTTPDHGELADQTIIIIWMDENENGDFDYEDKLIWISLVSRLPLVDLLNPQNSPCLRSDVIIEPEQTKHLVVTLWFLPLPNMEINFTKISQLLTLLLGEKLILNNNLAQGDSFQFDTEFDLQQPVPKPKWEKIAWSGFGDWDAPPLPEYNNYAWSMTYFKGDLYVGTGRLVPALVIDLLIMEGMIPEIDIPEIPSPPHPMNKSENYPLWLEGLRGEIWRYHSGEWTRVHQAPLYYEIPTEPYIVPEGNGYRVMTTFTDDNGIEAIYASAAAFFGGGPYIYRSNNGIDWELVNTTSLSEIHAGGWAGRCLTVHKGKLYTVVGTTIWCSSNPNPTTDTWTKVVDLADFDSSNIGIPYLISFNGHLYASTANPETGFQVWRSNEEDPASGGWTQIVSNGAGDTWNIAGMTMTPFKGYLYVGTCVPLGYDFTCEKGPKGFDLIRIDKNDNWELIVGSYLPVDPIETDHPRGLPKSGWSAGFGNIANSYCWTMTEHNGYLYLGTWDWSVFLQYLPDLAAYLFDEGKYDTDNLTELIEKFVENFGGGDLWKSPDGIHWTPVTLNGFNNPHNYGIRRLLSTPDGLYVGTANPFEGCEIWRKTDE